MSALGIRCRHCGTAGLPPVPHSKLGSGELTHPVAHVRHVIGDQRYGDPCWEGPAIVMAPEDAWVVEFKRMLWATEALWDL